MQSFIVVSVFIFESLRWFATFLITPRIAAMCCSIDQVKQLIESGVTVNFTDTLESSNTPLHWAASYGNEKMTECLCGKFPQFI